MFSTKSKQLFNAMLSCNSTREIFGGVLSADDIININNNTYKPKLYIVNSHEKGKQGEHWVVFFLASTHTEFWDSRAEKPEFYHDYWLSFLIVQGKPYVYNKTPIQDKLSSACGYFCLIYAILKAKSYSMCDIVNMFDSVYISDNDAFAVSFVRKHLNI